MNKFSKSFQLVKESSRILARDKEIFIFSLIAFALSSIVAFILFYDYFGSHISRENVPPEFILTTFIAYFLIIFIFTFGKAGITAVAYQRMSGGEPTFNSGLEQIQKNFYKILIWALFSATIGVLLQILKNKSNKFLRIFWGLFSITWDLIAFIVLPVVVIENSTISESVKKTEDFFKKTWGENLIGQFSISMFLSGWLIIFLLFAYTVASLPDFLRFPGFIFILFLFFGSITLANSLNAIYATGLYYYASTGKIPSEYNEDLIKGAFAPK